MDRWSKRLLPILLICVSMAGCGGAGKDESPVAPVDTGALQLRAPDKSPVGRPLEIEVRAQESVDTEILVTVAGSDGYRPYWAEMVDGRASFVLSAEQTRVAGKLTVAVLAGSQTAAVSIDLQPGVPVDPLIPLVGPRSIVADTEHWTMVVTMPSDLYDNPVADGTVVTVRARHPAADLKEQTPIQIATTIRHLISWARVWSGTYAGDMVLSVVSGDAHGPERSVREVPGPPARLEVIAYPDGLPADGRQLVQLETAQIKDQYGNVLVDGTRVDFLVDAGDGTRRLIPAVTIDGRAYATMQTPAKAGVHTLVVAVADVVSPSVTLTFVDGPAVNAIPLVVVFAPETLELTAGPLIGRLAQFVPDGTEVTFTVTGRDIAPLSVVAPADMGYATASIRMAALPPGTYDVTVHAGTGSGETKFRVQ